MRLSGQRALVTAAGQGIGRAVAIAFAEQGAEVVATDIKADSLDAVKRAAHVGIEVRTLDVTDRDAIEELAATEEARPYTVLFNCAGVVHAGSLLDCNDEELGFAWELNVLAMFRLCRAILPGMIAAGGGSIINMSSVASSIKAVPNRCAYSTTKAAVIGLTKSVAVDFIGAGVRCNAICPGTVDTPSLAERVAAQARAQSASIDEVRAQFVARQPMRRLGRPEEIAALAVYLASDESAFTTGAVHVVDGGWSN
jgi:2-keto-3-deoxy-L-fuconate dehydrogenase